MTRGELGLAVGACVGIALAVVGLGGRGGDAAIPDEAVAVVDGRAIMAADYHQALASIETDRRSALEPTLRRRVLERLIDEDLLVQRGLELELSRSDRKLRNATSAAVIDLIVARGRGAAQPDTEALAAFYQSHSDRFTTPERLSVRELFFTGPAAAERARAVSARLQAGADASEVMLHADRSPAPVPAGLLAPGTLRNYLGATALSAVLPLSPGEVTAPLTHAGGVRILQLVERTAGDPRPLEDVRDQVAAEYRRQSGEDRLREFLERQRRRAHIAIAEERL